MKYYMNKELDIYLSKEVVNNPSITEKGIFSYVALKLYYDTSMVFSKELNKPCKDIISRNTLLFRVLGMEEEEKLKTLQTINSFENGMKELVDINIISIKKFGTDLLIDFSSLHIDTQKGNFIVISLDEVIKIMNTDMTISKRMNLLKYFISLIGMFNYSKVGKFESFRYYIESVKIISSQLGIKKNTCLLYNDELEKLNIICIIRSDYRKSVKGKWVSPPNAYCRPEERTQCEVKYNNYLSTHGFMPVRNMGY